MFRVSVLQRALARITARHTPLITPHIIPRRYLSLPRRAIKVAPGEPVSSSQKPVEESSDEVLYLAEPRHRSFLSNMVFFYIGAPYNVAAFPLAALLILLLLLKLNKDYNDRRIYQSALKSSPLIETALGILAKAPFYADLVGVDPSTGAPNVPIVTKVSGSVPLTSLSSHYGDLREHVLNLELTVDGRKVNIQVTSRNLAPFFYDVEGKFHPMGLGDAKPFSRSVDLSAVPTTHITRMEVTSSLNTGGYVIRFADRPDDPWVRIQSIAYGGFLRMLAPSNQETYEATTTPYLPTQFKKPFEVNIAYRRGIAHPEAPHAIVRATPDTPLSFSEYVRPADVDNQLDTEVLGGLKAVSLNLSLSAQREAYNNVATTNVPQPSQLSFLKRTMNLLANTSNEYLGTSFPVITAPKFTPQQIFPMDVSPFSPAVGDAAVPTVGAAAYPLVCTAQTIRDARAYMSQDPGFTTLLKAAGGLPTNALHYAQHILHVAAVRTGDTSVPRDDKDLPPYNVMAANLDDVISRLKLVAAKPVMQDLLRLDGDELRVWNVSAMSPDGGVTLAPKRGTTAVATDTEVILPLEDLPCAQWYPLPHKGAEVEVLVSPARSEAVRPLLERGVDLAGIQRRLYEALFAELEQHHPDSAMRALRSVRKASLNQANESQVKAFAASTLVKSLVGDAEDKVLAVDPESGVKVMGNGAVAGEHGVLGHVYSGIDRLFTGSPSEKRALGSNLTKISVEPTRQGGLNLPWFPTDPVKYGIFAATLMAVVFGACTYIPFGSLANIVKAHSLVQPYASRFWYPSFRRFGNMLHGQVTLRINYRSATVELELLREGARRNWVIKRAALVTKKEKIDFKPHLHRIPYLTAVPMQLTKTPIRGSRFMKDSQQ